MGVDRSLGRARMVGAEELIGGLRIPGIELKTRNVLSKGSAEFVPDDWVTLAKGTASCLEGGVDGIVILHGTDTMQYTASALSFMIQGLSVPIVLTGAMKPGLERDSDSRGNLEAAVKVAARADLAETCVVFSKSEDGRSKSIFRGTRTKKISSTALNAFSSINENPLGDFGDGRIRLSRDRVRRGPRRLRIDTAIRGEVCLVKCHPAMTAEMLARTLSGCNGAVIEGTGIGHIRRDLLQEVKKFGRPTVLSTQCPIGGEALGMYDIDADILGVPNTIPSSDMAPETALVKLMWCLAKDLDFEKVKELMQTPLAGEIKKMYGRNI
ncbi:MAG: asparaginase [Nitrososphaerota archaeon]|nr:asparaginase [Nitrososphaerota archaeon]